MERCILHCDMNNFYASVECLYRPEIRNKPVAVTGDVESRHGIVLAKNMIAKKMGVTTGEAIWQAKNKAPNLVCVPPDYSKYLRFSRLARNILYNYTDRVEAFGLDENWADITGSLGLFSSAYDIAEEIRQRVKDELGVTVSIGLSWNKIFAKLGSDYQKPDAITVITKDNYQDIVWPLPVSDLLYVGRATTRKLLSRGIVTIGDLANSDPLLLQMFLGKWGLTLSSFAKGLDESPVRHIDERAVIKSIGNSITAPRDLTNDLDARLLFICLAESVAARLRENMLKSRYERKRYLSRPRGREIFEQIRAARQRQQGTAVSSAALPAAHGISARPRQNNPLQGVPQIKTQDAGLSLARRRPLPHTSHAYARSGTDSAHDGARPAPQRRSDRGDVHGARFGAYAFRSRGRRRSE